MPVVSPERDQAFRPIYDDAGSNVGYFSLSEPEDGNVYFTQIQIEKTSQGNGLGTALYLTAGREAQQDGHNLVSDPDSFSRAALMLWQSLERDGHAFRTDVGGSPYIDARGDVHGVGYQLAEA